MYQNSKAVSERRLQWWGVLDIYYPARIGLGRTLRAYWKIHGCLFGNLKEVA
jgi:hypothetical protein